VPNRLSGVGVGDWRRIWSGRVGGGTLRASWISCVRFSAIWVSQRTCQLTAGTAYYTVCKSCRGWSHSHAPFPKSKSWPTRVTVVHPMSDLKFPRDKSGDDEQLRCPAGKKCQLKLVDADSMLVQCSGPDPSQCPPAISFGEAFFCRAYLDAFRERRRSSRSSRLRYSLKRIIRKLENVIIVAVVVIGGIVLVSVFVDWLSASSPAPFFPPSNP
jgi:hypothetical protein